MAADTSDQAWFNGYEHARHLIITKGSDALRRWMAARRVDAGSPYMNGAKAALRDWNDSNGLPEDVDAC